MNAADLVAALDLPPSTRLDQRVTKKLLVENGAVTPADKRRINEGIEELTWVAALKPHTIGVPAYRDEVREYLEIAILALTLRAAAKADRIVELIHRAIPYPVLLLATQSAVLKLSVAHKRHAQNEAGKVVLDDGVTGAELPDAGSSSASLPPLGLSAQSRTNLWTVYQGWLECLEAIKAARITGRVVLAENPAQAAARRTALREHERLIGRIAALRKQAEREAQLPRCVDMNLELKRLEAALVAVRQQL